MEGFRLVARGGGQHLLASHPVLAVRVGPLGQSSIQSWMVVVRQGLLSFRNSYHTTFTSAEEIESVVSEVSTNSGWMVVE